LTFARSPSSRRIFAACHWASQTDVISVATASSVAQPAQRMSLTMFPKPYRMLAF
jgi:hypothetical protein